MYPENQRDDGCIPHHFTEPQQGATYDDLLAAARRAEQVLPRR